jgi:hypothetical protein
VIVQAQIGGLGALVSDTSWKVRTAQQWSVTALRKRWHDYIECYDARKEIDGWAVADFDDSGWANAGEVRHDPVAWPRIPAIEDLTERGIPQMASHEVWAEKVVQSGECQSFGAVESVLDQLLQDCYEPHAFTRLDSPQNLLSADRECARVVPVDVAVAPECGLRDVYVVLDFGREVVGYPRIRLRAGAGTVVDFAYSERLVGGRVPPHMQTIAYVDRYICREGWQEWEQFTWKGFRYMLLVFRELRAPVEVECVSLHFTTYPVEYRGSFESSDPLLDRIWQMGAYTTQLCMHDAYMDCPWREKAQWIGDARVEMLANYAAFGDRMLAARFHRTVAQSQTRLGITSQVAPFAGRTSRHPDGNETHEGFGGIPDYSLHWVSSLREYCMHTGDVSLGAQLLPAVARVLGWFEHFRNADGLLENLPGWLYIDWAFVEKEGISAAFNGLYVEALQNTAALARDAGDGAQAGRLAGLAAQTRAAITRVLWDETRGVFVDTYREGRQSRHVSMHSNAIAILAGAADPSMTTRALDYVMEPAHAASKTEPFFSHWLLLAMEKAGRTAEALRFIRDNWGRMVAAGSSTTWELWSQSTAVTGGGHRESQLDRAAGPLRQNVSSLAHAWSAAPTWFLPSVVLGIRPTAPGFSEFRVQPVFAGLERARGAMPTPRGEISVDWRRDGDRLSQTVTAPAGTRGTIVLVGVRSGTLIVDGEMPGFGAVVWRGDDTVEIVCGARTELRAMLG